jgi:hypothetical protein
MNKAAQALGRLAKGVPKTLTDKQRKFRAEQLAAARKKRHEKPNRTARRSNDPSSATPRKMTAASGRKCAEL